MRSHPTNCVLRKKIRSENQLKTFGLSDDVQLQRELMILQMTGSSGAVQTQKRFVCFAVRGWNGFRKAREPCPGGGKAIDRDRNGPTRVGLVIANGKRRGVFTGIAMNEIRPGTDQNFFKMVVAKNPRERSSDLGRESACFTCVTDGVALQWTEAEQVAQFCPRDAIGLPILEPEANANKRGPKAGLFIKVLGVAVVFDLQEKCRTATLF